MSEVGFAGMKRDARGGRGPTESGSRQARHRAIMVSNWLMISFSYGSSRDSHTLRQLSGFGVIAMVNRLYAFTFIIVLIGIGLAELVV